MAANPQTAVAVKWSTKRIPEPRTKTDVEWTATHRGLSVKATRHSYGSVMTYISGYVGTRSVGVFSYSDSRLTDDQLKFEALALADDLADMGMTGEAAKAVPS